MDNDSFIVGLIVGLVIATLICLIAFETTQAHELPSCPKADLAASFQQAVVDVLVRKTFLAAEEYKTKDILIAGGVSANSLLREHWPYSLEFRCDRVAEGVIQARQNIEVDLPTVVRLAGTNADIAAQMLEDSGLNFAVGHGLKDAAEKVVAAIG